eukprot:3212380-Pleurochrysis_carterae.AAC.2
MKITHWRKQQENRQMESKDKKHGSNDTCTRQCDARTGRWETSDMVKTGRTRARSRGIRREEQRQPDFANSADADAPDTQGTRASATGDGTSMEGTPPEVEDLEQESGTRGGDRATDGGRKR